MTTAFNLCGEKRTWNVCVGDIRVCVREKERQTECGVYALH